MRFLLFPLRRLGVRPTRSGLTEMRALTASLKLNGCRDTGFAFGISHPQKASDIARLYQSVIRWPYASVADAASGASSTSFYDCREDIGVIPIVMPKREFRKVQRQIVFAHLMIGADDPALQERPKAINVGGVDITSHIFMLAVIYRFMRISRREIPVAVRFIGRYQRNLVADGLSDKSVKCWLVCIFNHLANYILKKMKTDG